MCSQIRLHHRVATNQGRLHPGDVSNVSTVSIELQGKLLPFQHVPWDAWPLWARGFLALGVIQDGGWGRGGR